MRLAIRRLSSGQRSFSEGLVLTGAVCGEPSGSSGGLWVGAGDLALAESGLVEGVVFVDDFPTEERAERDDCWLCPLLVPLSWPNPICTLLFPSSVHPEPSLRPGFLLTPVRAKEGSRINMMCYN